MTAGTQLRELFELTYEVIRENIKDLRHEDSTSSADRTGNSINWILGHILHNRDRMLTMLKLQPVWSDAESSRYARGAPPLESGEDAIRFEKMVDLLEASQKRLLTGLEDEVALSKAVGERTLGGELFTFNFHESYHAGQLGIARRLIGKRGAIP